MVHRSIAPVNKREFAKQKWSLLNTPVKNELNYYKRDIEQENQSKPNKNQYFHHHHHQEKGEMGGKNK